jgi:hypothetical protein
VGIQGDTMPSGKKNSKYYYDKNPQSKAKKNKYNTSYHSTPERRKYRAKLNAANRKAGTYGNGDGKDMSHTKAGRIVKEKASRNRARNRGRK